MTADALGGASTPELALALFDRLAAVDVNTLNGSWRGAELPTGHPLDGLLEACHWHGKRFEGIDEVHPLVFRTPWGTCVCVRPWGASLAITLVTRFPLLKSRSIGRIAQWLLPVLATRRPQARLRMIEVRGRLSAAIVYDRQPIIDALRQVDADTLLGMMDFKGLAQPFFFVLRREANC